MDGGKLGQGDLEENVAYERWKEALVGRLAKRRPPYSEDGDRWDNDNCTCYHHDSIRLITA